MNEENWNKTAGAQSRAGEAGANLTDVLAADKRDAERYRWLRNRFSNDWGGPYFEMLEGKGCYALKQGSELDAAIDAEILKAANYI